MIRRLALLLCLSGCSSAEEEPEKKPLDVPTSVSLESPAAGSPSAASDVRELEPWSGQSVTVHGVFEHDRGIHGIVKLSSGLRVWLPHFDLFRRGDDWLKYVGKPCAASGILHTYTVDADGHRQVRLEVTDFSGTAN